MPNTPEFPTVSSSERAFRRGYLHGARAIVDCVAKRLPPSDHHSLNVWIALTLGPWAISGADSDPSPPTVPQL